MDHLAKYATEIARRLASRPADQIRYNSNELRALELLAQRILEEISAVRRNEVRSVGETSGMWPAVEHVQKR